MSRRRINILRQNETLSSETPEVQNAMLEELVENTKKINENEIYNISNEEIKDNVEETGDTIFKINDIVKIKPEIDNDIMGKRIHNGLKNYTYRILSVRIDGMLICECLTHCFTLRPEDVYKFE